MNQPTDRLIDQLTDRRADRVIGKFHFQYKALGARIESKNVFHSIYRALNVQMYERTT